MIQEDIEMIENGLKYYVRIENVNQRGFEPYNVFYHEYFVKDMQKNFKKNKDNREAFHEQLKRDARYYFWSKCEWEIIISSWPPSDRIKEIKVDAYDQLNMNWDVFTDYVWNHKKEICKIKFD